MGLMLSIYSPSMVQTWEDKLFEISILFHNISLLPNARPPVFFIYYCMGLAHESTGYSACPAGAHSCAHTEEKSQGPARVVMWWRCLPLLNVSLCKGHQLLRRICKEQSYISKMMNAMYPKMQCYWVTETAQLVWGWHIWRMGCHPEGPGQAWEMGPCESHVV